MNMSKQNLTLLKVADSVDNLGQVLLLPWRCSVDSITSIEQVPAVFVALHVAYQLAFYLSKATFAWTHNLRKRQDKDKHS